MRRYINTALAAVIMMLFVAGGANAQITGVLTPESISNVQSPGSTQTYTLNYSITVPSTATGKADVMFLTDTTGSMGGYIGGMKTAFSGILGKISAALPGLDIHYAVADYKDYLDGGAYRDPGVNLRQPFTSNTASVQTAINSLGASGGYDGPEEQLKSMKVIADNWLSEAYGGRTDAEKLMIWGGDYPGHYFGDAGSDGPATWYPSIADAISALNAQGVRTFGMNVMGNNAGIDQNYDGQGEQEDMITGATGGMSFYSVGSGGPTIEDAIVSSITGGVTTLSNITLNLTGDDGDFAVTPWSQTITGSWTNTTVTGSFSFSATAPGGPGVADFYMTLLGNGAELDKSHIHLTTAVPVPGAIVLGGIGLGLVRFLRRRQMV